MIKSFLTTAAATALFAGTAMAQTPPTVIIPSQAPPGVPTDGSTTIKATLAPDGSVRAQATQKSLDPDGQQVTSQHTYQSDPDGTRISHSQTQVDPVTGDATTNSTTTTSPR